MATFTFEQLAEKLNGKIWTKGDLKRIYLDRGYNTKKMSTKTYVEEVDGEFVVKCFIECPSQAWNWIKSQQEEVIESVEKDIENIIKISTLELVEYKINEEKAEADVLVKTDADSDAIWFTEEKFYEEFGSYPVDVFGGDLESDLEVIYEKRRELNKTKATESYENYFSGTPLKFGSTVLPKKIINTENPEFGVNNKVRHQNFGTGVVLAESDDKIEIDFSENKIGIKKLLKKFANLTPVNE